MSQELCLVMGQRRKQWASAGGSDQALSRVHLFRWTEFGVGAGGTPGRGPSTGKGLGSKRKTAGAVLLGAQSCEAQGQVRRDR